MRLHSPAVQIFVTGGAGFIGSAYVRAAPAGRVRRRAAGADVTVLDMLSYSGNRANLPVTDSRLRFVQGDIFDPALLREVLPGHDAVVHFAAESHVDRSIGGAAPVRDHQRARHPDAARRGACAPASAGSCTSPPTRCTARSSEGSWTETWPLAPNSPYSASKAGSDLIALAATAPTAWTSWSPAAPTTTARTSSRRRSSRCSSPTCSTASRCRSTATARNIRDWLHVDDHCRGIQLVLEKGRAGEVYNIGGGTELTNRELTGRLLAACGAGWDVVAPVTDRKGHDRRYSLDITKIREELGYAPQVGLDDGLAATVAWYRDNRDWWEPLKARGRRLMRWLVTGAGGMLGRDLSHGAGRGGRDRGGGRRPAPTWTSPTRPR